jgi:hypothetical protein
MGISLWAIWENFSNIDTTRILLAIIFGANYLCWGYLFNNFFDQDEDLPTKNLLKLIPREHSILIIASMQACLVYWSLTYKFLLEMIFIFVITLFYSVPPLRWKRFVAPALISNGIFFSFVFAATSLILKPSFSARDYWICLFIFLIFLPLQFIHVQEHREQDGITLKQKTKIFTLLLFMPILAIAFTMGGQSLSPPFVVALLYIAVIALILWKQSSAHRCRLALRKASLVFGIGFILLL